MKNKPELSNEEEVQELIELLGLKEHLNKSIDQLSGGSEAKSGTCENTGYETENLIIR